jgi:predicted phosphodiesterase
MQLTKETFLAFSCPHCPLIDTEARDWLLGQIADRKPDWLIHLGDGHEADSASKFRSEYDWELEDEFASHNELLSALRGAHPPARRVFLPGNHDDNRLAINRIDKRLRGLCDYRKHEPELAHWLQPAEYVYDKDRGVFRLGQVTFAHGYETHATSDAYHSILLGIPFGLYVGGHTHRPAPVLQVQKTAAVPLPYWYSNAGTIREIQNIPWMNRNRRHGWGQALVHGEAQTWRYQNVSMPTSPCWEAETVVFRMFGDIK